MPVYTRLPAAVIFEYLGLHLCRGLCAECLAQTEFVGDDAQFSDRLIFCNNEFYIFFFK